MIAPSWMSAFNVAKHPLPHRQASLRSIIVAPTLSY